MRRFFSTTFLSNGSSSILTSFLFNSYVLVRDQIVRFFNGTCKIVCTIHFLLVYFTGVVVRFVPEPLDAEYCCWDWPRGWLLPPPDPVPEDQWVYTSLHWPTTHSLEQNSLLAQPWTGFIQPGRPHRLCPELVPEVLEGEELDGVAEEVGGGTDVGVVVLLPELAVEAGECELAPAVLFGLTPWSMGEMGWWPICWLIWCIPPIIPFCITWNKKNMFKPFINDITQIRIFWPSLTISSRCYALCLMHYCQKIPSIWMILLINSPFSIPSSVKHPWFSPIEETGTIAGVLWYIWHFRFVFGPCKEWSKTKTSNEIIAEDGREWFIFK